MAFLFSISFSHADSGTGTGTDGFTYVYSYTYNSKVADNTQPADWVTNFTLDGDLMLSTTILSSTGNFGAKGGTVSNLTDGALPTNLSNVANFQTVGGLSGGSQLVYQFSTPVYLSTIDLFGGWNGYASARIALGSILYSTDDGANWVTITGYDGTSGNTGSGGSFLSLTPESTTYFGNGALITNLQFNFDAGSYNPEPSYYGLAEITAYGAVAAPEPGVWTLGLGGLLFLGLHCLSRRKALTHL